MKTKIILGLIVVAGLPLLSSCSKNDPKPDPMVGVWERDYFGLSDAPATHASYNGFIIPNSSISTGLFGDETYTLTLKSNKTYDLEITYPGPDFSDLGKWTLEGDKFTLNSDNTSIPDDEYTLEGDVTSKLVISQTLTFNLLPDAVSDTLTAWANTHQATINNYKVNVPIKVTYNFKKKV